MTVHEPGIPYPKGRRSLIEGLGSGVGSAIGSLAEHGVLLAVFGVIWAAFALGLLVSQGSLDAAWQAIRELPGIGQIVVWLLFLPVMVALWIWETTLPLVVRLVLVLGIGAWNLFIFLPRGASESP
jgi:hypothetical protein